MSSSTHAGRPQPPATHAALIERYFEVSLYLLVVTGFATLATTGRLDVPALVFVTAALLWRGYLLVRGRQWQIPERWTTYFTLVYIVFYALDFVLLSGTFVAATVHLVLFSMVVKIFSVQRDRDHLYLGILAFLEVLAAAVLTVDSVFLMAFCVFMLLAVTTFISMEMKRSSAAAAHSANAPPSWYSVRMGNNGRRGPRRSVRARLSEMPVALSTISMVIMLSIFVGAAVIFFLLPRVSAGYLGSFTPRNEFVTGFSNEVNLGQIGVIQQSSTVVMHVTIEGGQVDAQNLKWRGTSLESFNGHVWTSNPDSRGLVAQAGNFNLGLMRRFEGNPPAAARRTPYRSVRYRVVTEPLGIDVFFLTPTPEFLFGNYRSIRVDANGGVYDTDRDRPVTAYQALSNVGEPAAEELRGASTDYPPEIAWRYGQPLRVDPRVSALAEKITANAANPYDRARAIELYLRTNFGYTLQLPQTAPADPVANFLFVRKEGHCEFFASSMAVMLRTLGIPSRIVNGFRTGEYNDVTGSYIIRARDAHSWVEAYFPGYGWISFDPTPGAAAPPETAASRMLLYVDAMREFWREWIINYDFMHQNTLATQVTSQSRRFVDNGRRWVRHQYYSLLRRARSVREQASRAPGKWTGITLGILVFAFGLLSAKRLRRLWQRRRLMAAPERAPRAAAGIWYQRMTRTLARRGWRKQPEQSPREFVVSIEDEKLRRHVETFTKTYERARFGGSSEDARELPELYEEIKSK